MSFKTLFITLILSFVSSILFAADYHNVSCDGTYSGHLQGICLNDRDAIYWSFTTTLVKTDQAGKVLKKIKVASHHGDLCHRNGKLYVAVNLGRFNDAKGNADSWVYVYKASDLSFVSKHQVKEVFHGAGGIGIQGDHFFVIGGLPKGVQENYVYEYDTDFKFIKKHIIKSGHTDVGIQSATFSNGQWFFGCYGNPKILLVTDAHFKMIGRYEFDCSLGIVPLPSGQLFSASGKYEKNIGNTGKVEIVITDKKQGLRIIKEKSNAK